MLRSRHSGRFESAAELHALDGGNRKEQMGREALHRVEKRLSPTHRNTLYAALDNAAYRILRHTRAFYYLVEPRLVGRTAYLLYLGYEPNLLAQNLLGYRARRHEREGYASREVAAAARVVEAAELTLRHHVGMRRARMRRQIAVVARTGILIDELHGDGRPRGAALVYARHYVRSVALLARRGARRTCATPRQILFQIALRERYPRGNAVYHHTHLRSVRLAPERYSQSVAPCIHIIVPLPIPDRRKTRGSSSPRTRRSLSLSPRRSATPTRPSTWPCGGRCG